MNKQTTALVWFRQDLRCSDNEALSKATDEHQRIILIYIYDDKSPYPLGGAQRWWLHHSLKKLQQSLEKHKLSLCLKRGEPLSIIEKICKQHAVDAVYWSRRYEPLHIKQDNYLKTALKNKKITVTSCNSSLLTEPWTIFNKSGEYFKVFTPYWRHCLQEIKICDLHMVKKWPDAVPVASDQLEDWQLLPKKPNWAIEFADYWQPGEQGAAKKLKVFIDEELDNYHQGRDNPADDATSRLSPHLHFGEIGPRQIWQSLIAASHHAKIKGKALDTFLSELGWREFSYYLLYHFPELPTKNFKAKFDGFAWQHDKKIYKLWQQGQTGFPIVDAGMRQLWRTGFMHNRVRMIVASFLIKDLLIDWRQGADWFWDTLVDADLASNSASWQWVAGSGADASPYFRIFNPVLQGEKFDPTGDYVRQWVPELAKVAVNRIHQPWLASEEELNGVELGRDYPQPIVDHAEARNYALNQYKNLANPKE